MERPNINDYPIVKNGKHQYFIDDLYKYLDYLEEKIKNQLKDK